MAQYSQAPATVIAPENQYTATINTNLGPLVIELFPKDAPNTVNNLVFLAREGFYDGVPFHRVIKNFMVQGGDPTGTGRGGPGYNFEDECVPTLTFNGPGILAMANAGPNTNGSQFFLTLAATTWLNGKHTIFGRITDGQDLLDKIGKLPTDAQDRPKDAVTIQSIEIGETAPGD